MDELDLGATLKGFSPGQSVFGRYTLKRIAGRGGMGVVWLARDEELGLDTALKFLPEAIATDRAAMDDLKREVRRAIDLAHPHIVKIHHFLTDGRMAAVAMEYVAGDTLSSRRVDQPARVLSAAQLRPWVKQLGDALDYAHGVVQVVHRDLKPSNLMVNARGDVKILDFGIAASLSESVTRVSKQAGSSSGTPVYMSPQQMMGERPAVTDDVYSLGATLFELLSGKPPFYTGNVVLQVQGKKPPSIQERRWELGVNAEAVPPAWEETIAACLEKDPKDRPQSAGEVAQRLASRAVASPPPPPAPVAVEVPAAQPPVIVPASPAAPAGGARRLALMLVAIAAGTLLVGALGWWAGVLLPEQRRAAAHVKEVQDQSRIQAEQEDRAFVGIAAKIAAVIPGTNIAVHDQTDAAVREYLASAPERHRAEVEERWRRQAAAWSAHEFATSPLRGGILIRTNPTGAEVRVGAVAIEESPLTLKEQRLGRYPVRIRLEGYEDWNGEIEVKANEFAELDVDLVRVRGILVFESTPAGATVRISGDEAGDGIFKDETGTEQVTPFRGSMPTGDYVVEISHRGYVTHSESVSVGANAEIRVSATLEKAGPPNLGRAHQVAGLGLSMRRIDPGSFLMGSPAGETGRDADETQHAVELTETFWLGQHEVTMGQWRELMGTDVKQQVQQMLLDDTEFMLAGKRQTFRSYWGLPRDGDAGTRVGNTADDLPMVYVSWNEAMEFCRRLNERERAAGRLPEGYEYTLPTEAQWEYACRAGSTAATPAGDLDVLGRNHAPQADRIAWYAGNSSHGYEGIGWDTTDWPEKQYPGGRAGYRRVGTKEANAWGLHDMLGNVREWCFDANRTFTADAAVDPRGSPTGANRVIRGAAWNSGATAVRSAYRNWEEPGIKYRDLGFRLALAPVR